MPQDVVVVSQWMALFHPKVVLGQFPTWNYRAHCYKRTIYWMGYKTGLLTTVLIKNSRAVL